jgi:hypothetical protein
MVIDPVALPAPVGANVEVSVTLAEGFTVTGAVTPLTWYALPLTEMPEMCTAAVPVLLTTICWLELPPTAIVPKLTFAGEADNWPTEAAEPVPLSATLRVGLFGSLLAMLTLPVALPTVVGANRTLKDVLAPAAIVAGVVSPLTLKLLPVTEICEMVSEAVPAFVNVKLCDLFCPSVMVPKL